MRILHDSGDSLAFIPHITPVVGARLISVILGAHVMDLAPADSGGAGGKIRPLTTRAASQPLYAVSF